MDNEQYIGDYISNLKTFSGFCNSIFIMINPFDYLQYKIYKTMSWLIGNGSERYYGILFSLYFLNIITITTILIGRQLSDTFAISCGFCILVVGLIFYRKKRERNVIAKYKNESERSRIIGNFAVVLYVILSIVSFFWTARYF